MGLLSDVEKVGNTTYMCSSTAKTLRPQVKCWMRANYSDHVDLIVGSLNTTTLAEDAARQFELYAPDNECTIPQDVYEWASEVDDSLIRLGLVEEQ